MNELLDQAKKNAISTQELASLASKCAKEAYDYYQLLLQKQHISKKGKKSRKKNKKN